MKIDNEVEYDKTLQSVNTRLNNIETQLAQLNLVGAQPSPILDLISRLEKLEGKTAKGYNSDDTIPVDTTDFLPTKKPRCSDGCPPNVEERPLEEIRADYNEFFSPPQYDIQGEWSNDAPLTLDDLFDVQRSYNDCVCYSFVEQGSCMDCFVRHVESVLGPSSLQMRLRKPVAFFREDQYYTVSGFYVVSDAIVSVVQEFFDNPTIAQTIRKRGLIGKKSYDTIFQDMVLVRERSRFLWANVVANALLLRNELGRNSYVDRERIRSVRGTFQKSKEDAIRDFVAFQEKK